MKQIAKLQLEQQIIWSHQPAHLATRDRINSGNVFISLIILLVFVIVTRPFSYVVIFLSVAVVLYMWFKPAIKARVIDALTQDDPRNLDSRNLHFFNRDPADYIYYVTNMGIVEHDKHLQRKQYLQFCDIESVHSYQRKRGHDVVFYANASLKNNKIVFIDVLDVNELHAVLNNELSTDKLHF